MENFRNTELNIPIAKVAEALGLRPGSVKDMYFSPMRDEKEASLHIDRNKNLWHDHGNGMGGTVAQLVMVARHCSKHEAYEFLRALDPSVAPEHLPHALRHAMNLLCNQGDRFIIGFIVMLRI